MKTLSLLFVATLTAMTLGCGSNEDRSSEGSDLLAFYGETSNEISTINLDGELMGQYGRKPVSPKVWPEQFPILYTACTGRVAGEGAQVKMISPEGVPLGDLDETWVPSWSPAGDKVAVSCASDGDGNAVVVNNVEKSGEKLDGWSRTGEGSLSDLMEIYLIGIDASSLTKLTYNNAGDWLPQWHPSMPLLIVESNRDGNSEIYLLSTINTNSWRLTDNETSDQSPVWSREGGFAAFLSDASGEFKISIWDDKREESISETGVTGKPIPWPE